MDTLSQPEKQELDPLPKPFDPPRKAYFVPFCIVAAMVVLQPLLIVFGQINMRTDFVLFVAPFLLFPLAIATAAARRKPLWLHLGSEVLEPSFIKRQDKPAIIIPLLRTASADRDLMRLLTASCLVLVLAYIEQSLANAFYAGGLLAVFTTAWMSSLIPPAIATACLYRKRVLKLQAVKTRLPVKRSGSAIVRSIDSFFTNRLPYLSAYLGFIIFCLVLSFSPAGLGFSIASWLHASALDARIATGTASPIWTLTVSSVIAFVLFGALRRIAIRCCAGFQVFMRRLFVYADGPLEALMETANIRGTAVALPELHPYLSTISGTWFWLLCCYCMLFFLVAFCPPPLGSAVRDWIQGCIRDAGLTASLQDHLNFRLFLASVVAAYGTVPFAIMSCAFLPSKKPKSLIVSSEGILCPDSAGNLLGLSPFKLWSDLRQVALLNEKEPEKQVIRLSFKGSGSIKLKIAQLRPEHVTEILAAADEYGTGSRIDPGAIALRSRLAEETKSTVIAQANKFSSTIFTPRKGGDFLNDGQYRIVRKLAGKALSAVYLARDHNDRHVVIKEFVMPSSAQHRDRMTATFDREYSILSQLKHENIAQVIDMFQEAEARYIVIEHVQGSDLRTIVQRRGFRSEKTAIFWAVNIARVMSFLHEQKPPIIHRDLTPDNLMEDLDGNIKLIDFGAAHQFMEGVTGTLIGKQCYIAPEQLRGKPSTRSDIYSFGCMLYFFITGKEPRALKRCDLLAEGIEVSASLSNLVKRCTEFEETDRFASFTDIIEYLIVSANEERVNDADQVHTVTEGELNGATLVQTVNVGRVNETNLVQKVNDGEVNENELTKPVTNSSSVPISTDPSGVFTQSPESGDSQT